MFAIFRLKNGYASLVDVCWSESDARNQSFNCNRLYAEEQQAIFYYKKIK